jgi:hypothetical protein
VAGGVSGFPTSREATTPRPLRLHGVLTIVAMFAVGVGIVIWRRPDAVTYPQFWAEDGQSWFADAYNMGVASLFRSEAGYLQTLPRLFAIPAAHLSLQQAALLFNVVGISIQVAPAAFIVSRRFEHLAPRMWVRAIVGLVYLLIPCSELNATVTNAQWHLAILAVMVLVARPPARVVSRVFDGAVVVLSGLTGPFAVLLLPAAGARVLLSRAQRRWYLVITGILAATLSLQAWVALHSHRSMESLGVGLKNLAFVITDRIVLAGSFAEEGHTHVFTAGRTHGETIAILVAILAGTVVGFVLLKSGWPLRIFVLFCFATTATAMLSPLASADSTPAWTILATTGGAERYFFSAEVAWIVCVIWALSRLRAPALRWGSIVVAAALFASGLAAYGQYQPYADYHPATYEAQLRTAAPGTVVVVPINPGWTMSLRRGN